ncbi:hypothetical protein TMatcc_006477 [Talaromyces marneffei ATCC 18224]|uniref:DUF202 domain-containing protein n=2 Tax=Talaromyces marneffei TaxID=37727 RepID=B6QAP1_TALMQ|nr:uncharacterized protein EYB26_002585 [Talaromyces marneffei]EEA25299.1 conserved hypothetical protein [Talaromyces marneffei ATCC 18224]KAE8554030.1 hypothetical protein EYB25_002568 [Talaromyces marneffei]QGA14929.1 hypothetical protein EYB26_002585 [Talaromyces marneffei]
MSIATRLRQRLFPKPVLNNGSQLRDHLANERTFLSWTRMGLAFAAMALALGRLGMIDHVFYNTQFGNNSVSKEIKPAIGSDKDNHDVKSPSAGQSDILASQLCWTISIGSFGYGIFRYVSVRRTLIQGRFVPAIWGPVLMTTCSLGSLATLLHSGSGFQRHEAK